MKTLSIVLMCLALAPAGSKAQVANTPITTSQPTVPAPTPYRVVDLGANYRLWQCETYEQLGNGQVMAHGHAYTELSSGLNYKNASGQWSPAQELIEGFAGGAIARQGQNQVIFANNLNSAGSVDMQTPDGKRLRSNVLGLMYYDPTTGDAAQIAQVQDSEGTLVADNEVLYPNAFQGVKADVLYSYRCDGMEQDVILREQLPAPEAFGMSSATTEFEVFTEFLNPPPASVGDVASFEPGLESDQIVGWGATSLGRGKAFSLGGEDSQATVIKRYVTSHGRYFLQEKVKYQDIQPALAKLPEQASNAHPVPGLASKNLPLLKARSEQTAGRPIHLAMSPLPDKGYVLDYVTVNAAYTNYTFQGDTTYYVSGTLNLYGTNTFEGGTVIKVATNGSISIVYGTSVPVMNWKGGAYRPVVFTAKDDNTVGENIGTGTPTGFYGNPMLSISSVSSPNILTGLRMSYARTALSYAGGSHNLYSAQFVNCQNGLTISGASVFLGNVLFVNIQTNFIFQPGGTVNAQNTTMNGEILLASAPNLQEGCNLALTNCILANVTNLVSGLLFATNGNYNGFYNTPYLSTLAPVAFTSAFYPFQKVGGASCYLSNGCSFFNNGTTNIDNATLSLIATKTTYAPIIYSNLTSSVVSTFSPQIQRDTDTPDLGYHYDPLDYVFGGVNMYSNVTFTAGTAVGYFELPGSGGNGYGISIYDHVVLALNGTAVQPCTVARYSTVQEGGTGLWKDKGSLAAIIGQSLSGGYSMNATNAAQVWPNFTRHAALAADPNAYREYSALLKLVGNNSEFWLAGSGAYWMFFSFTNCLFDRAGFAVQGSNPALCGMRNCTMHGGTVILDKYGGTWPVWVEDSAFDGTSLTVDDNSSGNTNITYCDFNAFLTNGNRLPMHGTHDVTNLLTFNWQSSWFGNYYQSTNSPLINKGSTTADQFGLYHFTTQTNQVPETNSIVDIAYHYVATDTNGIPLDTNGDGIPDYLEDANGNGLVDSGEIGWNMIGDLGLNVIITRPRNGSTLP